MGTSSVWVPLLPSRVQITTSVEQSLNKRTPSAEQLPSCELEHINVQKMELLVNLPGYLVMSVQISLDINSLNVKSFLLIYMCMSILAKDVSD